MTQASPPGRSPWRLLLLLSLALLAMAGAILAASGGSVDGIRLVIRSTARTSLVLFLLAFSATGLQRLGLPWPRRQRRQLGLSFAASHGIHLAAIAALWRLHPDVFREASTGNPVPGAITYGFIAAMALTSFDRAVAWLGGKTWRALHLTGSLLVWVSFLVANGRRAPAAPAYWIAVVLLVGAMALRLSTGRLRRLEARPA